MGKNWHHVKKRNTGSSVKSAKRDGINRKKFFLVTHASMLLADKLQQMFYFYFVVY